MNTIKLEKKCPNCSNMLGRVLEESKIICALCGRLLKNKENKNPTLQERIDWWLR